MTFLLCVICRDCSLFVGASLRLRNHYERELRGRHGKTRIELEPFINEGVRQFIVNGVDMYNIATTRWPDYFPVSFVLRGERSEVLGGARPALGGWLQLELFEFDDASAAVNLNGRI